MARESIYLLNSKGNLLPLSREQADFAKAVEEWRFTGVCILSPEGPNFSCELCEHDGLAFHFEIENRHTGAVLKVGSTCIRRFGVDVRDAKGMKLYGDEVGKELNRVRARTRREADPEWQAMNAIRVARRKEAAARGRSLKVIKRAMEEDTADFEDALDNIARAYRCRPLSPRQALLVRWRLAATKVEHDPADFLVDTTSERAQEQLKEMSVYKLRQLIPYTVNKPLRR